MPNQQELSSDEMYGIGKRINRELEAFPLHTHGAIMQMVTVGFQHRNEVMKHAHMQQQQDAQERILRIKEHEMDMQRQANEQNAAAALGPLLVTGDGIPGPN